MGQPILANLGQETGHCRLQREEPRLRRRKTNEPTEAEAAAVLLPPRATDGPSPASGSGCLCRKQPAESPACRPGEEVQLGGAIIIGEARNRYTQKTDTAALGVRTLQ